MLRRVTSNRRLVRKRMFKSPHVRHRTSQFKRENKNMAKPFQKKFKEMNGPNIKRKKRPKREVITGFKMSYRNKYFKSKIPDEVDETEESE